jgi:uncharacterized protein (DUF1778 family)
MTTYTISTDAYDFTVEAENEHAAILAYVREAGYDTIAEAAEVLGETESQFISRQVVSA